MEAPFLDAVADGDFQLVDLVADDARRAAALVRTYTDLPLGPTDATDITGGALEDERKTELLAGPRSDASAPSPMSPT